MEETYCAIANDKNTSLTSLIFKIIGKTSNILNQKGQLHFASMWQSISIISWYFGASLGIYSYVQMFHYKIEVYYCWVYT